MLTTLTHQDLTGLLAVAGDLAAAATLPGSLELALLTFGALRGAGAHGQAQTLPPLRLAVVVPAHDEQEGIARCVRSLAACHRCPGLEVDVVVVADNCSDATADRARLAGARVLERRDESKRGKGHALAWAFPQVLADGADAVVVVDADTSAEPGLLLAVASRLAAGADAVQAPYGVRNPDASPRTRLMNLALLAFNRARPRGRAGLGLSVGLLGNGFALSRRALERLPWEAASVVEDLEYHLRMVEAGLSVAWAGEAGVLADMPERSSAAGQQRVRWEGGRLRMIAEHAPRLLAQVARGRGRFVEPLLELCLLPLSLHLALLVLGLAASSLAAKSLAAAGLALLAAHVVTAAMRCGRGLRDLAALAVVPRYLAWKASLLPATVRGAARGAAWVRTPREGVTGATR